MREFVVTKSNSSLPASGAGMLYYINNTTAPNVNLEFLRYWVGFSLNATSAQQRVLVVSMSLTTSDPLSSSGTAFTPVKLKSADPNASVIIGDSVGTAGTVSIDVSNFTSGNFVTQMADAFNVLNGWLHVPTPPETRVAPAQTSTVTSQIGFGAILPGNTQSGFSYGLIYREV